MEAMTLACGLCSAPVVWARDGKETWVKFDSRPVRTGLRFSIERPEAPRVARVVRVLGLWPQRGYRLHTEEAADD